MEPVVRSLTDLLERPILSEDDGVQLRWIDHFQTVLHGNGVEHVLEKRQESSLLRIAGNAIEHSSTASDRADHRVIPRRGELADDICPLPCRCVAVEILVVLLTNQISLSFSRIPLVQVDEGIDGWNERIIFNQPNEGIISPLPLTEVEQGLVPGDAILVHLQFVRGVVTIVDALVVVDLDELDRRGVLRHRIVVVIDHNAHVDRRRDPRVPSQVFSELDRFRIGCSSEIADCRLRPTHALPFALYGGLI